uniref:hypothetical protein n=1 Tax=Pseudomonas sp. 32_A TaxID=2813559 RepID=UPI001A9F6618
TQLGLDAASSTIHTLDLDACRNALRLVEQFMSRKSPPAHSYYGFAPFAPNALRQLTRNLP